MTRPYTEPYAFVTLEVYTVENCGDYPNGSCDFTQLLITDGTSQVTPQWQPQTQPGCQEAIKVNSPTSVTVKF